MEKSFNIAGWKISDERCKAISTRGFKGRRGSGMSFLPASDWPEFSPVTPPNCTWDSETSTRGSRKNDLNMLALSQAATLKSRTLHPVDISQEFSGF